MGKKKEKEDNNKNDEELQNKLDNIFGEDKPFHSFDNSGFSVEDFIKDFTSLNVKEDVKQESELRELIAAIEQVYSDKNIEKKTRLTATNIKGIIQLCTINRFFSEKYGFRITIYDEVIIRKMRLNISLNGRGREELLKLFDSLGSTFSEQRNLGLWSKLMGKSI